MNADYTELLPLINEYNVEGRTESAAFLGWYLENFYRLDSSEAIDHICDQANDKGVDGIYINDANGSIDILQTKLNENPSRRIGDKVLREFSGTLSQFKNKETLRKLRTTLTDNLLAQLIDRLDLIDKFDAYTVRGIFLSNVELDPAGEDYLKGQENIEFVGKWYLETYYISPEKTLQEGNTFTFDISDSEIINYQYDDKDFAIIAVLKSDELTAMPGVASQSVFAYNVRGPLGNTKVNRDIIKTIKNDELHEKFPLFHNGITVVANDIIISEDKNKLTLDTFYVVNGCQSLTALFQNRSLLTHRLKVLVKIIKVDVESELSKQITKNSNNQNGVRPRDFKANNRIQIRLQNEFQEFYGEEFFYEIQRGENDRGLETISNEDAGIRLMTFDLMEPWNTRRKYQIFDEKYNDIFARPEVNADRIVALTVIEEVILDEVKKIENSLVATYDMTRYTIMYIVAKIFNQDEWGQKMLSEPQKYIRTISDRIAFEKVVRSLVEDIVIDINGEVNDMGEDFDYKSKYRDKEWIESLSREVIGNYLKMLRRGRIESLEEEWNKVVNSEK